MENFRAALIVCTLALAPVRVLATGDFYEESLPTLPMFLTLDRLPGKSLEHILAGTRSQPATPEHFDFQKECLRIASALEGQPPREFLRLVDRMLVAARFDRGPGYAAGVANILHDLHDALTAAADADRRELGAFLRWRVDHTAWFGFRWRQPAAEPRSPWDEPELPAGAAEEIEKQLAAAAPALQPHWLYLRGALGFKAGDDTVSASYFQRLLDEHPDSPRAETALFMLARCRLSQSRSNGDGSKYVSDPTKRAEAVALFDAHLVKFPNGRFAGDTLGWLGAAAYDGGDFTRALGFYLRQLEFPGHPEFLRSATAMCEKVLSRIASDPNDAAFALIAKTPALAEALVRLIVSSTEADHFNEEYDEAEAVRRWRESILPRVAKAIAAEAPLYADAKWHPRYVATLALAASGAERQDEALKLVGSVSTVGWRGVELLFVRGVALQRARRGAAAAAVFEELLKANHDGPFTDAARLRLALARVDEHRAGLAVVALGPLARQPEPERSYPPKEPFGLLPGDPGQARQLADALLNFAPIPELAAALADPALDPLDRMQLNEALACRHLAREQFEEAKRYVTPAQWSLTAAGLEKLTRAAKAARSPKEKAAACLALGDAWATARGRLLTTPFDTASQRRTVFRDDHALANVRRAENAASVGAQGVLLDLENRDELRHAFNWWLEASDAQPATTLAATALWRALRAMPAIADVSPFSLQRAQERDWSKVSRQLYDRLLRECPASEEARRLAVYWTFPVPAEEKDAPEFRGPSGGVRLGSEVFVKDNEAAGSDAGAKNVGSLLRFEKQAGDWDQAKLKAEVDRDLAWAREHIKGLADQFQINFLEDLSLFLKTPTLTPAVRARYIGLRTETLASSAFGYWPDVPSRYQAESSGERDELLRRDIRAALAEPAMRPVADFLEFLDAAVVAHHFINVPFPEADGDKAPDTFRTRDYPLLAKMTAAFLEKYPRSRKREAALLLHARATFLAVKPVIFEKLVSWPIAGRWEGGYETLRLERERFDAKRILAALDRYDREFPDGRFSSAIRSFRAGVALRERDWKTALGGTLAPLDDAEKAWLQPEAADRLGDIFGELADEKVRAELLAAIKPNAAARARLLEYLASEDDAHPLLYLKGWLREQLGANEPE